MCALRSSKMCVYVIYSVKQIVAMLYARDTNDRKLKSFYVCEG